MLLLPHIELQFVEHGLQTGELVGCRRDGNTVGRSQVGLRMRLKLSAAGDSGCDFQRALVEHTDGPLRLLRAGESLAESVRTSGMVRRNRAQPSAAECTHKQRKEVASTHLLLAARLFGARRCGLHGDGLVEGGTSGTCEGRVARLRSLPRTHSDMK
jgi:hypothetical protein